jgi:hypothetical protein
MPDQRVSGALSPKQAVLAATAVVRGERFCDGTIDQAARNGLLHAILKSLATWYSPAQD